MSEILVPPASGVTEASIAHMIDTFYARIRRDAVLGPIFEAAIAPDEWTAHLATMRRFWSSVMLASGRYSGNPVGVHRAVAGLERPMFECWLTLFAATVEELFEPDIAAQFEVKARRIAGSLELAIFHRLGAPPDGLPPRRGTAAKPNAETEACD